MVYSAKHTYSKAKMTTQMCKLCSLLLQLKAKIVGTLKKLQVVLSFKGGIHVREGVFV